MKREELQRLIAQRESLPAFLKGDHDAEIIESLERAIMEFQIHASFKSIVLTFYYDDNQHNRGALDCPWWREVCAWNTAQYSLNSANYSRVWDDIMRKIAQSWHRKYPNEHIKIKKGFLVFEL